VNAAVTLSLTGPFARQGREAARGLAQWADEAGVALTVVDDGGSRAQAARAYGGWLEAGVDLLLGPYGSGLVRAVAAPVCAAGRLLWNHGGSADDLARPGLASLPAPASTYFHGAVDEAAARGIGRLLVARGAGPFAVAVSEGAAARAAAHGLHAHTVPAATLAAAGAPAPPAAAGPGGAATPAAAGPGSAATPAAKAAGAPAPPAAAGREGAVVLADADLAGAAVLVVGRFEEDVALVRRLRGAGRGAGPALLAAVAAGLPAFGELGEAAEGVLGPVQWWPASRTPRVGPSGAGFAAAYRRRVGHEPSYVAAQAAAAGHLALAAHRLGLAPADLPGWRTSTLLGDFALDGAWRQVGHRVTTIRWRDGRMVPAAPNAVQFPRGRDS
jgi:ABC-type branched-subunit amino acid transport system substrate-binding protein